MVINSNPSQAATITVDDDGGADFTSIQDAINASHNGDTIYVWSGTYNENLIINKSVSLIGNSSTNTTLDGRGNHGINITSNNTLIQNIEITNCSTGIYVKNASFFIQNISINSCTFSNFSVGVEIHNTSYINFTHNTMVGMDLDNDTDNVSVLGINISGIGIDLPGFPISIGILTNGSEETNISNNNISNTLLGIGVVNLEMFLSNHTIENNTISDSIIGVLLLGEDNCTVANNAIVGASFDINLSSIPLLSEINLSNIPLSAGIILLDSEYVEISNNTISNTLLGIGSINLLGYIFEIAPGQNSSHNTIENNTISDSILGVLIFGEENSTVANNTIVGASFDLDPSIIENISLPEGFDLSELGIDLSDMPLSAGIILLDSEYIEISNNTISNTLLGIGSINIFSYIMELIPAGNSSYHTIENNFINDSILGIAFAIEDNCTVTRNTVTDNLVGMFLFYSVDNRIYDNCFYNTINVIDYYDGNNTWNISKTLAAPETNIIGGSYIGGNFWGDYDGSDTNGDGLGNTSLPYNSSGLIENSGDYLPLIPEGVVYNVERGTWHSTIQGAVDNASPSNTLVVYNGTYYENVVIKKSVTLMAGASPVIDGMDGVGVSVEANDTVIQDMRITNCSIGVKVCNNSFTLQDITLLSNTLYNNTEFGIECIDVNNSLIGDNSIYNTSNAAGLRLNASTNNTIWNNNLSDNMVGMNLTASSNNSIYHNDFINNSRQALDNATNTWDNGYPSGGNYWSNFDEPNEGAYDNNSDGIIDSPYNNISGGSNCDRYPLAGPWGERPYQPTLVLPYPDGATGVSTSPTLEVRVTDPNNDTMNVSFYDASNGQQIDSTVTNVANGNNASVTWSNRDYSYIYTWYVIVNDSTYLTRSENWSFTTQSSPPSPGGNPSSSPLPSGPTNHLPVANASAGEPYVDFVGLPVKFDGSLSNDSDGNITKWFWDFGDETNGSGKTVTHIYYQPGTYTVTLTVTDDDGATGTDKTTAIISKQNRPPTSPTINGPLTGHKNTAYTYTTVSTDPDNDTIKYIFDWEDGNKESSKFLQNGTLFTINHTWMVAGKYTVTVTATDNKTNSSSKIIVLIDILYVEHIGYLNDNNSNEIYDLFHSNETGKETVVELKDQIYLIDSDGDGDWDYIYDPASKELTPYEEKPSKEFPWLLAIIGIIIAIVVIIAILYFAGYIYIEKEHIKEQPSEEHQSKEQQPENQQSNE